jgi:hypothetical protein
LPSETLAATTTAAHIFEVECRSNAFSYQNSRKRWRYRLELESRLLERKKQLATKHHCSSSGDRMLVVRLTINSISLSFHQCAKFGGDSGY